MYQQTAICCTLNNVPMTASALQKSRLPFGIHLYPFAQDEGIPVIGPSVDGSNSIVRCHTCRAYINPYVRIGSPEHRSWQCNLCNRLNELPPQFIYDYSSQQYYDLGTKQELTCESVEYIANAEYMVRPPQPACYMFVLDCSKAAIETGYIPVLASVIADQLDEMPGDARASIGFIAYDSNVHYFSFSGTQVVHHACPDVSVTTIPCPNDGILANISSSRHMILDFLTQTLPNFPNCDGHSQSQTADTRSALGPAIKAAVQVLKNIGGKITIVQTQLANHGPSDDGSVLTMRESLNNRPTNDKNGEHITPLINLASDFYKNLALECCEYQISVDIFNLSTGYADLASVGPLAKFSAGSIFHYSNSISERNSTLVRFDQDLRNYLVRPIGLESVLRLRLSRGLKIHTFHGNFFVRSENLLVLPNANPDASYALQIAIEDDLRPDTRFVYFQASVLYTTPDGERRIRVHTAKYATASTLPEIMYGANQTAVIALLAKMAVDRSLGASIGEAKEALIGAAVDMLEIYRLVDEMRANSYAWSLPENLRLVPLYVLALLKHLAFKMNTTVRLDDRTAAMERFKTLPVDDLITYIYPDLFPLHNIASDSNEDWRNPIQLTAAHIERNGAYLLDAHDVMIIYICEYIDPRWCYDVFGVRDYASIPEQQDIQTNDSQNPNNQFRPRDPANFLAGTGGPLSQNNPSKTNPSSGKIISAASIAETPLVRLPELDNPISNKLREFVNYIIETRPQKPKFYILKENSRVRSLFTQYLVDDRSESYHSYAEFWRFLQDQARS